MIHSYVIGRGNTATAYLQAGMIRPVPGATADAVVDVQAALGRRVPGEATLSWAGRTPTPNAGGKAPQKIYWEGNILNKISKKIVALVTMAAFVLTLVPFAAFAAAGTVDDSTARAVVVNGEKATVSITVGDTDFAETANLVVWATKSGDASDAAIAQSATAGVTYGNVKETTVYQQDWNNAVVLAKPAAAGTVSVDVTFAEEGDYTIYAALNENTAANLDGLQIIKSFAFTRDAESDRSKSDFGVVENKKVQSTATVDVNEEFDATFLVNDAYADMTTTPLPSSKVIAGGDHLYVWAIDNETNDKTSYFKINGNTVGVDNAIDLGQVVNGQDITVTFTRDGNYTLYAGVGADADDAMNNKLKSATTITVNDNTEVASMTLAAGWVDYVNNQAQAEAALNAPIFTYDEDAETYTLDLTQVADFNFNGIDKVVLHGTALEKDGSAAKYQTINFTVNEPNTVVELDKNSDNTSNTGTFDVAFTMHSQKNAVITVTDEATGEFYDVLVVAQKTSATNIDRTKTGGYVLATTDTQWSKKVNANLGGAVEFKITDEKGNAVEGLKTTDFVIDVRDKAAKSTLTASALKVVEVGDGFYTLKVDATKGSNVLTEGKYEVRVALNGVDSENDNATVTFNAAEFGKIKDVELNITDITNQNNIALDDQITLGTIAEVSLVYVDANGVKVAGPKNFNWNATNSALALEDLTGGNSFTLKPDTIEHQGVIGSVVKVQASVKDYGLVEKELTIVSSYNEYSLEIDPVEGPVNEYNKVDLSVLNSDGDVAKNISGKVKVVAIDSSNDDAKVSVEPNGRVKNGEGALTVYASQETELEIVVTIVDTETGKIIAAGTLNYTVGAADPLAGRSVVMTIGSTEYVVNNQIITGDAAPFVDSNWRTMVPIRALAEAFDAEVIWDNDARTVTINYDANTQIVMTVGEETYTVNGAEQTMDTEPVIQGERTYVPIRFAAEALGFTVTPLYTAEGTTGSVVFQK